MNIEMRLPQQGSLFICPFSLHLWFIQNTQLTIPINYPCFSYFGASAKVVHLLRAELEDRRLRSLKKRV